MKWSYILLFSTAVNCYPKLPCITPDGMCPSELECAINNQEDCEVGNFKPNATDCGCCPACVKYLERGEPCHRVEIPQLYECGDDLVCSERTGTCVPPSAESPLVEEALFMAKESRFSNINCQEAAELNSGKFPNCTESGAYAPKQCKDEVCFCVSVDGKVISRYKAPLMNSDRMECICARVEMERNSGRICDEYGNYKPT